jgi:hypothetical protein
MAVESLGKLRRANHAVALAASRLRVTRARDLPAVCDSIRLSEAASGHGTICSPSNKTINLSCGFNPIFSSNARSRGERPGRRGFPRPGRTTPSDTANIGQRTIACAKPKSFCGLGYALRTRLALSHRKTPNHCSRTVSRTNLCAYSRSQRFYRKSAFMISGRMPSPGKCRVMLLRP